MLQEIFVNLVGKIFKGIANIGKRPTVNDRGILLEVNIFDFNEDIYGKKLFISLIHFIREEKKFDGIESLKLQIIKDVEISKSFLKSIFKELHLKVIFQEESFSGSLKDDFALLTSSKLSGSPHALLHESSFYAEIKSLLDDMSQTNEYQSQPDTLELKEALP